MHYKPVYKPFINRLTMPGDFRSVNNGFKPYMYFIFYIIGYGSTFTTTVPCNLIVSPSMEVSEIDRDLLEAPGENSASRDQNHGDQI